MKEKRKFETYDLIKLGILLVLLLVAVFFAWKSNQDAYRTEDIALGETELTEIEAKAATQIAAEESKPGMDSDSGEKALETEIDEPTGSGENVLDFPPLPESSQGLLLVVEEEVLINNNGAIIYELSVDRLTWIPAVLVEFSDNIASGEPQQDAEGNWVLEGIDGQIVYLWDEENLIWIAVEQSSELVVDEITGTDESDSGTSSDMGESSGEDDTSNTGNVESKEPEQPGETTTSDTSGTSEDAATENVDSQEPVDTQGNESNEESQTSGETTLPGFEITESDYQVPTTYVINRGEFVFCISRRFNLNPNDVLRLNGLRYYSVLQPGMVLRIPRTGKPFPTNRVLKPHPTEHKVVAGDSIYTIACKFGDVYPGAIISANQLPPPYNLTPGQVLVIP